MGPAVSAARAKSVTCSITPRLRDAVGDEEWLALVETIAFARTAREVPEFSFSDGAGI
jgi:hypothetical protein